MPENDNERRLKSTGLVFLLGALTAFDPLTIDMYLPAFGRIREDFNTTIDRVEMSVAAFFVGMALGQLLYGPLADRFGRKKPLLVGMLLYFAATLGCALSPTIEAFIGFRVLQALGGCAGMVISRAIIRDLFDKKHAAIFLSNMALVMGLAPILAPSMGSLINDTFGWRAIFFSLASANVVCLAAIFAWLPETNAARSPAIRIGRVLRAYGGLLRDRNFVGYLIPDTAIRAGMFAYISGSPFVFIELLGIPANRYGLIFGLNGLGLMAASQINRRLLRRYSPDLILRWSVRLAALAAIVVFLSAWANPSQLAILSSLFVFLASLNFVGPNSLAGAMASQGKQAGTASALYGCLQWSLASVSSLLVGYFHNGTAMPMASMILFCGLLSLIAFQLLVTERRPVTET